MTCRWQSSEGWTLHLALFCSGEVLPDLLSWTQFAGGRHLCPSYEHGSHLFDGKSCLIVCLPACLAFSLEKRSGTMGTSTQMSPKTSAIMTDVLILLPERWNDSRGISAPPFPNTSKSWCNKQGNLNVKKADEWKRFRIGLLGWIFRRCEGAREQVTWRDAARSWHTALHFSCLCVSVIWKVLWMWWYA